MRIWGFFRFLADSVGDAIRRLGGGREAPSERPSKPPAAQPQSSASVARSDTYQAQNLRRGSTGQEVRALQEFLKQQGFDPGPIDGIFGPRTQQAVEAYQRARGLTPDGVVGPQTKAAIARDRSIQQQRGSRGVENPAAVGPASRVPSTRQNPSRAEAISYITEQAKANGLPPELALATAMTESNMRQFKKDGSPVINVNKGGSRDIGMFQINERQWGKKYDTERLAEDWKYNARAGVEILKGAYEYAVRQKEPDPIRAAYSVYNGGPDDVSRYRTENHPNDARFEYHRSNRTWLME